MFVNWLIYFSFPIFAALPPSVEQIEALLKQPPSQNLAIMKNMGNSGEKALEAMAFDKGLSMETRWKSFTLLTQLAENQGPLIERALKHSQWFMRSAGLTVLESVDSGQAKAWARHQLLKDPALMVRMKALEILTSDPDDQTLDLFWRKMFSADSFHHNKGLWIRHDIAIALSKYVRRKDLSKWVRLLHEKDIKIQKTAAFAITQLQPRDPASQVEFDLSQLKQMYPQKKSL